MRVAYLGPAGTFSEEALRLAAAGHEYEPAPAATINAAVAAVESGAAERALVPFENSIEGTVRPTLDALAFEAEHVRIVGEFDHRVQPALIAAGPIEPAAVERVLSHPQPIAQCARFLRSELPAATIDAVSSTAEAVRRVLDAPDRPWAALGSPAAAAAYGGTVLREDVADVADNVTRFAWLAMDRAPVPAEEPGRAWRTTLVFDELGDDRPGALVEALAALSDRGVNMTRIESRPRRSGLGAYMFFIDLEGRADRGAVADGIEALRERAGTVRVLGSYQVGAAPPLAA
jgi:prephenate dehydratase